MAKIPYEQRKFDAKKKQAYDRQYFKENFDRINFVMPKGTKDVIKERAESEGISAAEWIRQAIDEKLSK